MQKKLLIITAALLMLLSPVAAVKNFNTSGYNVSVEVFAPVDITRDLPSPVKTNQPFDVNLHFYYLVDLELFNISIKETIPAGYKIKKEKKIFPEPAYIADEDGATVIYWNIDVLANHTNLSMGYSLSAPKSAGNYTFSADAFGYDAFNNEYAAVNSTTQEVKKQSIWKKLLNLIGLDK